MSDDNVVKIPIDMSGTPRPAPVGCKHDLHNSADCGVTFLEDLNRWVLEVKVLCRRCGARFRFEKLPVAISVTQPCVDVMGFTVSLPIVPEEACPHMDGNTRCGSIGKQPCKTWRGDPFKDGTRHEERDAR